MQQHPPILAPLGDVTTERLELRRFTSADLESLVELFAEPAVWRFPYGRGFTRAETAAFLDAQLEAWETTGFGLWLAAERSSQCVVGFVGLSIPTFLPEILPAVEVGWRFHPNYWGKGLASEGARAALSEGFGSLGLSVICSLPQADNARSYQVCERLGMERKREVTIPANERRGALRAFLYELRAEAWAAAGG